MDKVDVTKREELPIEAVESAYTPDPSEETLKDLGERLRVRYRELSEIRERSDWEKEKAEAFDSYHMAEQQRDLPWEGASNLTCWLPRMVIDSIHAYRMQAIFGQGRRVKVKVSEYPKESADTAKRAAKYMAYILNEEVKLYPVMDDADLKAEKFGVGYLEPRYVREKVVETADIEKETVTPEMSPVTGKLELKTKKEKKTEKKERTVFDGTKVDSLPVDSIFISPFMRTIEEAVKNDMVFKKFPISVDLLDERTKGKNPLYRKEPVELLKNRVLKQKLERSSELEMSRSMQDGFFRDRLISKEIVDLAVGHLWYDIDNDDKKEKITVVFSPETGDIFRVSLSKCRIVALNPHPVDERFWGEGDYKILKQFCTQWEAINNTRVNAGQWENSPFGFYQAGGRLNPATYSFMPGRFYPVDNAQSVVFAQTPSVRPSYFQEEQLLMMYVEKLIGLPEPIVPRTSKRGNTATGNIQEAQQAGVRFNNPLNRVLWPVEELMGHIWELNQECAPKEKEFFIVGAGNTLVFDNMRREDYQAQMRFKLEIETTFDKQMARDTSLLVWRLMRQSPTFQMNPAAAWELDTKVLEALDFEINIPMPPQAKALSPFEMIQMVKEGQNPDPIVGEDYDEHLRQYKAILTSEAINEWDIDAVQRLTQLYDKTQLLKAMLEKANLNQSGLPNIPPGMGNGKGGPGTQVTASRNPSQLFNNMRVGENGGSMRANNGNSGAS